MKKVVLIVVMIISLGLVACAVLRRPVKGRTLETRPIAPAEQTKIRAAAADAEAAAAEQQSRLTPPKSNP